MFRQTTSPFWVTLCVTLFLILTQSTTAVVLLITDGSMAAGILAAATLAGTWLVPRRIGEPLPVRWRVLLGAGWGLGLLSTTVLLAGCAGILDRRTWMAGTGVLILAAIAAGFRWRDARAAQPRRGRGSAEMGACGSMEATGWGPVRWLWVMVAPFAALALLSAVLPAGVLWAEEGYGYDVLEYHLQLPKEYLAAGRIGYTPHNVYGNFPANAEMLYLLCMILCGDAYAGAAVGQLVNAVLGGMCVFAAFVAGAEHSRRAGMLCAVLMAGLGWLTYLSGIAYVENGLLLFGTLATAAVVRAEGADRWNGCGDGEWHGGTSTGPVPTDSGGDVLSAGVVTGRRLRWVALAGGMSGFACGFKYSALGLVWLPLLFVVGLLNWSGWRGRTLGVAVFGIASCVTFAPWMMRGVIQTGNPVFPLAHSIFRAHPDGWGEVESEHFAACHRPGQDESSFAGRVRAIWVRIIADRDQRFGPLVLVLAAARCVGIIGRRGGRIDRLLGAMLLVQALVWMLGTHLYARFAVPLAVPLVVLAGRHAAEVVTPRGRGLLVAVVAVGMSFNSAMVGRLYGEHVYPTGTKVPLEGAAWAFQEGAVPGYEHLAVINGELPDDAKVLMIGDAKAFYFQRAVDYCVVFNRNPFVERLRRDGDPGRLMAWMRSQGYSHVMVHWAEINRLRRSRYGFATEVTPDLFEGMWGVGLEEMCAFKAGVSNRVYATLYRVGPKPAGRAGI